MIYVIHGNKITFIVIVIVNTHLVFTYTDGLSPMLTWYTPPDKCNIHLVHSFSDHWTHTPRMYSVATKSWWVLHSWLIEGPLWNDPRGLHNRISERSWIRLPDMNGHISNTTLYSNQSQLTTSSSCIDLHHWTPPLDFVQHNTPYNYLIHFDLFPPTQTQSSTFIST